MLWASRWIVALSILTLFEIPASHTQGFDNPISQGSPPTLETVERPKSRYPLGETIPYRIRVRWAQLSDKARMSPPDLILDNLELVGVSQESFSESNDQLLTFRFAGKKAGPAKIARFKLRWIQEDGVLSSELAVPTIVLTIVPSHKIKDPLTLLAGSLLGTLLLVPLFIFFIRKRRKTNVHEPPTQSVEDDTLNQFRKISHDWELNPIQHDVFKELKDVIERYASQKLDWNPSREDYNALQKKAEEKWSKKEASQLINLLQTLDYERFSGTSFEREKIATLYEALFSFIERKRVV